MLLYSTFGQQSTSVWCINVWVRLEQSAIVLETCTVNKEQTRTPERGLAWRGGVASLPGAMVWPGVAWRDDLFMGTLVKVAPQTSTTSERRTSVFDGWWQRYHRRRLHKTWIPRTDVAFLRMRTVINNVLSLRHTELCCSSACSFRGGRWGCEIPVASKNVASWFWWKFSLCLNFVVC